MLANGRGGRTQHSLVCSDGRKTWWAPREVNLTLSAAAATSFVYLQPFRREAEAAGVPEQKSWCRTKKLMNQHILAVAELPVTNSIISPLSKVSANSSFLPFLSSPTSHVS
ncbi:hypothetical protein GWK47_053373 [Chionoecetes opilio]|uniref:Uncharacterized protein n=1 Tax=Chionoecetes opilio TaxID=41210 RepID=A0A8J4Y0R4_CHIOP|nr:hypothetical protein GWK47_053373 [Chionoecetes opilio]